MPDQSYWNERYLQGATGWDMGQLSPPLQAYLHQLTARDLSILVPGWGRSFAAARPSAATKKNIPGCWGGS